MLDETGRNAATRCFSDIVRSSPDLHHAMEAMAGNRQSITEFLSDKVTELRDTATIKGWQGRFLLNQVNEIDVGQVPDDLMPRSVASIPEPPRRSFVASLIAVRQSAPRGRG